MMVSDFLTATGGWMDRVVRWHSISCICGDCLDSDIVVIYWGNLKYQIAFGADAAVREKYQRDLVEVVRKQEWLETRIRGERYGNVG